MNSKHQKLLSKSQLNRKIKNQFNNYLTLCSNTNNSCMENKNLLDEQPSCVQATEDNFLSETLLKSTYINAQEVNNRPVEFINLNKNESHSISSSISSNEPNLISEIQTWSINHNITHSALKDLLLILKNQPELKNISIPKDPRTFLNTPRHIDVKYINDSRTYFHLA